MMRFSPILGLVFACGEIQPTEHELAGEPAPAGKQADRTGTTDETAWPYETLSAPERAVVDRGRVVTGWHRVHRGFADAVRDNAARAQKLEEAGR